MVVSSVTPFTVSAMVAHLGPSVASTFRRVSLKAINSSESPISVAGTKPASSHCLPRMTAMVASPPSSRIMLGNTPSPQLKIWLMHHQYSGKVSPFQAKTGTPAGLSGVPSFPTTTAAAASSWVEKILHEAQRTSAPSATSVSMRTAVWTVMWIDPAMRAPRSGCSSAYSARNCMRPGISYSARRI